jgi:hypothetical protein
MARVALLSLLFLSPLVSAAGTQFITGPCTSDADCASGCCGFNSGLCAGSIIALTRDGGCGHGDGTPNANAANALGQGTFTVAGAAAGVAATATVQDASSPAAAAVAATGTQFITGPCTSDADCASGCCGFNSGLCAGSIIALTRDGGCGHGDTSPNANAANTLGQGTFTVKGAASTAAAAVATGGTPGQATSFPPPADATRVAPSAAPVTSAAGTTTTGKGAGNGVGAQFITGPCTSDADCASGCCGFNSGKCAGAVVAQERDGGCGFGDPQPNDNAAKALSGNQRRGLWDD